MCRIDKQSKKKKKMPWTVSWWVAGLPHGNARAVTKSSLLKNSNLSIHIIKIILMFSSKTFILDKIYFPSAHFSSLFCFIFRFFLIALFFIFYFSFHFILFLSFWSFFSCLTFLNFSPFFFVQFSFLFLVLFIFYFFHKGPFFPSFLVISSSWSVFHVSPIVGFSFKFFSFCYLILRWVLLYYLFF